MRKAASYLVLLLTCAACSDAADDASTASLGDPKAATTNTAGGSGGDSGGSEEAARDSTSVGAVVPAATAPSSGSSSPGGAAGGVGGLGVGGGASIGALAGTAVGGGAAFGGGGASSGPGGTSAVPALGAGAPIAPTPSPMMPVFPTTMPTPQGGQLTAGAWDDNMNFTRFTQFRNDVEQRRPTGIMPFSDADFDEAYQKFSKPRAAHQQLDVALVIDTTGSMGDEIAYLQREFSDLSSAIESAYPMAEQRWALVVYKDVGDTYVTRQFDFRSDLNALRTDLLGQSAGGGGDFPEAPEAAFEKLNQFQWRTGAEVARLAFWVADAPHHDNKASALAAALRATQEKDIHVYPVASSGIDEFTELTMRSSAQLTGGRYLFLTNDSGIGGSHKEPSIPCYFVTRLDHAILRMVTIEMTGVHSEPEMAQIIRTGGNPQDGACTLASGTEVEIF